MKITLAQEVRMVRYGDIGEGTVFKHNAEYFMKGDEKTDRSNILSICLNDGVMEAFTDSCEVQLVTGVELKVNV